MKMKIYSIKDTVIGAFQQPFYQYNQGTALRALTNAINDEQPNAIKENSKDKQLYCLGEYDDVTGEIIPNITFIVNLNELEAKKGE